MKHALSILATLSLAACGSAQKPSTSQDMVSKGAALFADACAHCHGDAGQGTDKGPPVVGADALPLAPRPGQKRDVQFHTALDVFGWVRVNMPGDAPGTLSDDDYLAIMAFDLSANGVDLKDEPLDGPTAAEIVLHP